METNAILLENDLILTPYEDELLKDLPPPDYIPTESDISGREDLRSTCIFTIDPATAVDLDDALSCRPLENGNFEVLFYSKDFTKNLIIFLHCYSNHLLAWCTHSRCDTLFGGILTSRPQSRETGHDRLLG